MKNETETVVEYNIPTWEGVLPLLLAGVERGNAAAREELHRMAKLADAYIAARKGGAL